MLTVGCTLLVALLAAPAVALVLGSCRALEVANGTVTSLPGATPYPDLPREGSSRQCYHSLGVLWLTKQRMDYHRKHTGSEGRAAQRHWGLFMLPE